MIRINTKPGHHVIDTERTYPRTTNGVDAAFKDADYATWLECESFHKHLAHKWVTRFGVVIAVGTALAVAFGVIK